MRKGEMPATVASRPPGSGAAAFRAAGSTTPLESEARVASCWPGGRGDRGARGGAEGAEEEAAARAAGGRAARSATRIPAAQERAQTEEHGHADGGGDHGRHGVEHARGGAGQGGGAGEGDEHEQEGDAEGRAAPREQAGHGGKEQRGEGHDREEDGLVGGADPGDDHLLDGRRREVDDDGPHGQHRRGGGVGEGGHKVPGRDAGQRREDTDQCVPGPGGRRGGPDRGVGSGAQVGHAEGSYLRGCADVEERRAFVP